MAASTILNAEFSRLPPRLLRKQILDLHALRDDALRQRVADQGFDCFAIGFNAIRQRVTAHGDHLLMDLIGGI